jgi:uncharacterized protein YdbL (DUF1318 family)
MKYKLLTMMAAVSLGGCGHMMTQKMELDPDAATIEIMTGEPNREECEYLGEVSGEAKAVDIAEATNNARNGLKNNAFKLEANVVKLDTTHAANAMDWTGRNKVVLHGRAFDCEI